MKKARRLTILIAVIFFSCHFAAAQDVSQTELIKVSFQKSELKAECIIECTKPVAYESFSLMNPNRLVVDLTKIEKVSSSPQIQVNDSGILKITTSMQSADTARIVVYFLGDVLKYEISETDEGINLIFELKEKAAAPVKKITPLAPKKPVTKISEQKTPVQIKPKVSADSIRVKDMSIGVGGGYFCPQDSLLQDLYGKSIVNYRVEMSFVLPFNVNNFDIWTAVSHYRKSGKTSYYEEDIRFSHTMFSIAVRYLRKIDIFTPFAGFGMDYISYKEIFPESFAFPSVGGSKMGYHLQTGIYIHMIPALSGKLMVKYNSAKTVDNNLELNLGGMEYGIGLIFHFNL